jgi:hypothetical protein
MNMDSRTLAQVVDKLQAAGLELQGCTGRCMKKGKIEWTLVAAMDRVFIRGTGQTVQEAIDELMVGKDTWLGSLS